MPLPEETTSAFLEYEELKSKAKFIEKRLKELQPLIMPHIPEGKEIQGKSGKFYIQARTTYKFSANVENAQAKVDELKAEEKAKGIATAQVSETLYYKEESPE